MCDPFATMAGAEKSLRLARRYALESNYDVAVAFYTGLEKDLTALLGPYEDITDNNNNNNNISENASASLLQPADVIKWGQLRGKAREELAAVISLQEELRALVCPSDAARLDRGLRVSPSRQRPTRNSFPGKTETNNIYNNNNNISGNSDGPAVGAAHHGGNYRAKKFSPPPVSKRADEGPGALNQIMYGDKDRFGPPQGPAIIKSQQPQRLISGQKTQISHASPVTRGRLHSGNTPCKSSSPSSNAKVKVISRRVEKNTESGGRRQGARATVPRFAARSGEEELVSLIEADMHVGKMTVSWNEIAGLDEAKRLLEEAVVYPVLMPDYFQGIRRPWKGVLLYGPPGTGKTMLAKAVASECNTTFFNISPATLTSKWRGDSEKLIRVLFEMARYYAPSTIFIDEIDSLCGQRGDGGEHEASRRAKGTLLAQMDGVGVDPGKIVMVLGATNHPWSIDEAMRRRLEKRIYIPLPDKNDRIELFKINTQSLKLSTDVDFKHLSNLLEGRHYSCADITNLVRDAAMMTMRRFMEETDKSELKQRAAEIGKLVAEQPTTMNDFLSAVKNVPSSVNVDQISKFEKWKKEFETNL